MSVDNDKKGPAVKFPPPLVFVFCMLIAGLIQRYWPLSLPDLIGVTAIGTLIAFVGLAIVVIAKLSFSRVGTEIEPWKPTSAIVQDGIFAYSRNPIYLAFCIITIGLGFIVGSVWVLVSFLPAVTVVYFIAIKNEEAYLERKFGDEYLAYKQKVRRWV
jgi:protein-S-isoprenylcysteine O-methyltransferase Ste14